MTKAKSAFTLAEVLITLVVIGVIAALAIPALIKNIQDSQNRTAWRRTFSDINQATRKLALDNSGSLRGVFNNINDVRDELSTYLIPAKKCDSESALGIDGCWSAQTNNLSGSSFSLWDISARSRMVLNNGILLAFYIYSTDCTYDRAAKDNGCATIAVDVNGFKEPNTLGKDIFWGFITEDGNFEPFGKLGDLWTTDNVYGCDLNANGSALGFTCAAQYLQQ